MDKSIFQYNTMKTSCPEQENTKKSRINMHEVLFYASVFYFIGVGYFIGGYNLSPLQAEIYGIIRSILNPVFVCLLVFCCLISIKPTQKQMLLIILCACIIGIACVVSKDIRLFSSFALVLASNKLPFKQIAKFVFYLSATLIIIAFIFSLIGVLADNVTYRTDNIWASLGVDVRHSWGFIHANRFAGDLFKCMLAYIYYKYDSLRKRNYIVLILITLFSVNTTDSRTVFILSCVTLAFLIYSKRKNAFISRVFKMIFVPISFVFSAACILLTMQYANNSSGTTMHLLNQISNTRLFSMAYFYLNYGITLFGNNVEMVSSREAMLTGQQWLGLDNSYMSIVINYGIGVLIVFCVCISKLSHYAIQNHDKALIVLINCFLFYSLTESGLIYASNSFVLLALGCALFKGPYSLDKFRLKSE